MSSTTICGALKATLLPGFCLDRPRPLELAAADEMIARENIDILRQNGFEIAVKGGDNDVDDEESEVRERVYLVAQPVSKSTVFDMKGE